MYIKARDNLKSFQKDPYKKLKNAGFEATEAKRLTLLFEERREQKNRQSPMEINQHEESSENEGERQFLVSTKNRNCNKEKDSMKERLVGISSDEEESVKGNHAMTSDFNMSAETSEDEEEPLERKERTQRQRRATQKRKDLESEKLKKKMEQKQKKQKKDTKENAQQDIWNAVVPVELQAEAWNAPVTSSTTLLKTLKQSSTIEQVPFNS